MHNSLATYLYNRRIIDPIGLSLRNFSAKISEIETHYFMNTKFEEEIYLFMYNNSNQYLVGFLEQEELT